MNDHGHSTTELEGEIERILRIVAEEYGRDPENDEDDD